MLARFLDETGHATGLAAGALLGSIVADGLASQQSELWSDLVAWTALLAAFRVVRRLDSSGGRRITDKATAAAEPFAHEAPGSFASSPAALWIVALCLGAVCVFKTELGIVALVPVLTPLLLVVELCIRPGGHRPSPAAPLANTVWGTLPVAALAAGTLSSWRLWCHLPSIAPAAALLLAYTTLTPRTEPHAAGLARHLLPRPSDIEGVVVPLAWRVIVVLAAAIGAETALFGFPTCSATTAVTAGIARALSSLFLILTVARHTSSWRIATAVATFSLVVTQDPFTQTSDAEILAHVAAALLSLAQVVHLLPREARLRPALWAFCLVPLVPFLADVVAVHQNAPPALVPGQEHPVRAMMRRAQSDFALMLSRQSRSATAAAVEYRRRYAADPPPGFDAWYAYAAAQRSPVIDEFDALHRSMVPLVALSGRDILDRMRRVQQAPDSELWLCAFAGQSATTRCTHPTRAFDRNLQLHFNTLLGSLPGALPDVTFLVNHFDEPRVLYPPDASAPGADGLINVTNLAQQPAWDALTKHCTPRPGHGATATTVARAYGNRFPSVTDRNMAMDLCTHAEYGAMHGLAVSPASFRLLEGLVPVLSTGALSTMGDVLYPSPAYLEPEFRYDSADDVAWERKRNTVFWAGSTTGGFAADDGQWQHFHRQRFVRLAQNLGAGSGEALRWYYLRPQAEEPRGGGDGDGHPTLRPVPSTFLNRRLYDVGFSRILQCAPPACRAQRTFFRMRPWAPPSAALRSQLVFDTDGNGISGRFYKLLASRSAPLKQTLLSEWHDARLAPWVHYFPVHPSLQDLPELVAYLTSAASGGQAAAHQVAEQGRAWSAQAFRDVDMAVYLYRLLLELARLQDPGRPAGSWSSNASRPLGPW